MKQLISVLENNQHYTATLRKETLTRWANFLPGKNFPTMAGNQIPISLKKFYELSIQKSNLRLLKQVKFVKQVSKQEETIHGGWWVGNPENSEIISYKSTAQSQAAHAHNETTSILSKRTYYSVERKTDILEM